MDENVFWISIWGFFAIVLLGIVVGVTIYNVHEDSSIHDLVVKGKDPIELSCLYNASSPGIAASCLFLSQQKEIKKTK